MSVDKQAMLSRIYALNEPLPERSRALNAEEEFEKRIGRRLAATPSGTVYFIARDDRAHLMTGLLLRRIHSEIRRKVPVLAGITFGELRDRVLLWATSHPIHRLEEVTT